MINTQTQSVLYNLQQQLTNKKEEFRQAIADGKEFILAKQIYMEIKEVEKELQNCIEKLTEPK